MKHNSEQLASSSAEPFDNELENEKISINSTDQEVVSLIKTSLEKQSLLEYPPEGWQTIKDIVDERLEGKVSRSVVTKIVNELNLEGKKFRISSKWSATFYSPEDIEKIINHEKIQKLLSLEDPPEGWQTPGDISKQLKEKVSEATVTKTAKTLGLEGKKFRSRGSSRKEVIFYSPEDIEKIINHEAIQELLSLEDPPEGWQTAEYIATKRLEGKVSDSTVTNIAKNKLGLEGRKFRVSNRWPATFYSPEDIEKIINHEKIQKLLSLEDHPEGWQTIKDIVDERLEGKVSRSTVTDTINKLGLKGKKFRGSSGQEVTFYSPEDIEKIINHENMINHETIQKLLSLENPPEGWQTIKDIVDERLEGKVSRSVVTKIVNELNLEGKKFRISSKWSATFYSPEDIEKIINHESIQKLISLENHPEGWQAASDIAKQLEGKVSSTTITDIARKLGLEGKEFRRSRGQSTIFYSPEDIEKIINHETIKKLLSLEYPPEGWQTAEYIATKQLGGKISQGEVTYTANNTLGLKGKKFRGISGQEVTFYSPEDIEKIINHEKIQKLISLENPPEGWQAASDIAKQLEGKVSSTTITDIARKLGLEGKEFRRSRGQSTIFYSPEEQNEIIEKAEKSTLRSSFPEQAIAFYLQKAGISIWQDCRPDWMKNLDTKRNLEIDIFIPFDNPPPLGIGIEYDGVFWHKNPDYDAKKNALSRKEGVEIIHIREKGCPELPSLDNGPAIACINRQDNRSNSSLDECIEQVLSKYLGIHLSDGLVDVSRDQAAIFDFMEASEKIIQDTDNVAEEDLKDDTLQAA